jgi:hypothetical protein
MGELGGMTIETTNHGTWIDAHGVEHTAWTAIDLDTYDGPPALVGYCTTREEATADLLEQLEG